MRVPRRIFALGAAAAGLGSATGCLSAPAILDPDPMPTVVRAQEPPKPASAIAPPPASLTAGRGPLPDPTPPAAPSDTPLPVNLATALQLANARPLDVQIAGRQVEVAAAVYDRAKLLWVPNIVLGTDYFAHTGLQQNFQGELPRANRSTFMFGFGPNVVFNFSDAVYAPLAARQDLRARQAVQQATTNDAALQVAEAFFAVQQARGDLAGSLLIEARAEELVEKATQLAKGLAPPQEETRAKVELGRRKQVTVAARERWRTASAELARLLRLDPSAVVEPAEPPFLPVTVIDPNVMVDDLIPIALTTRPELAGSQAVVQATLTRLKQEKLRPLVPSLALRSVSTNPSGSLGYGVFGGGPNDSLKNFGGRFDIDMQVLWEFQALGFGNRVRVQERKAEYEVATLELFRTQDRVAAEVVAAFAQVRAAADRLAQAEPALREALDLVTRSLEGMSQTRRVGDVLTLVIRPQEAVAAVQALGQANTDFFSAVADYNRAQFRLYRALGHPARALAGSVPGESNATPNPPPAAQPAPPPAIPKVETEPPPQPRPTPTSDLPPATGLMPVPGLTDLSRPPVIVREPVPPGS